MSCRIILWVTTSSFTMEPRYNIYYSLGEVPRYWAVPNPPTGSNQVSDLYANILNIVDLHDTYFTVQGIK